MSELRWNWVYYPYLDAPNKQEESALKAGYIKVVSKDVADKVIADLKAENEKLNAQFYPLYEELKRVKDENESLKKTLQHSEDELESYFIFEKEIKQELRRHKYKRCMDMAKRCKLWYEKEKCEWQLKDVHHWFRMSLFDKWQKRWLEIAEKFKEVK